MRPRCVRCSALSLDMPMRSILQFQQLTSSTVPQACFLNEGIHRDLAMLHVGPRRTMPLR